jgi:hypothetical protein
MACQVDSVNRIHNVKLLFAFVFHKEKKQRCNIIRLPHYNQILYKIKQIADITNLAANVHIVT